MFDLKLDDKFDILMIMFTDNSNSYATESRNGIEVFRNIDSKEITAIMIYDFCKRYNNNSLGKVSFPIDIDFRNIYKQVCKH